MNNQWNTEQASYPGSSQNAPLHLVLPPGWISVVDPVSGKTYYANPSTGQTSWEPPKFPLPPPPPLPMPPQQSQLSPPPVDVGDFPSDPVHPNTSYQEGLNIGQNSVGVAHAHQQGGIILDGSNLTAHVSSLQASGIFLPAVRTIIQSDNKEEETNADNIEFPELSSGVIADLAHVQSNYREEQEVEQQSNLNSKHGDNGNEKKWYYESLKPMDLPIASKAPPIESGRVDIRIMSLMDELKRIEKQ